MDSNSGCDDPKSAEVNRDFFSLSYEWILDYVLQQHKVLSQDLNHKLITDNLSVITEQAHTLNFFFFLTKECLQIQLINNK